MTPEAADWDEARAAWNRAADQRPSAVSMQPWTCDGGYFNFAERPCDVDAILPAETCARLAGIKRRWDPAGMIQANHMPSPAPV